MRRAEEERRRDGSLSSFFFRSSLSSPFRARVPRAHSPLQRDDDESIVYSCLLVYRRLHKHPHKALYCKKKKKSFLVAIFFFLSLSVFLPPKPHPHPGLSTLSLPSLVPYAIPPPANGWKAAALTSSSALETEATTREGSRASTTSTTTCGRGCDGGCGAG